MSEEKKEDPTQPSSSRKPRRQFTVEQRMALLDKADTPGQSIAIVARKHGISPSLLFRWRQLREQGAMAGLKADEELVPVSEMKAARSKIRELQRLLGKKTEEVEILGKASGVAFFRNPSRNPHALCTQDSLSAECSSRFSKGALGSPGWPSSDIYRLGAENNVSLARGQVRDHPGRVLRRQRREVTLDHARPATPSAHRRSPSCRVEQSVRPMLTGPPLPGKSVIDLIRRAWHQGESGGAISAVAKWRDAGHRGRRQGGLGRSL